MVSQAAAESVSDFSHETLAKLQGLDVLVIDAQQYREHPSHLSLQQALQFIEVLNPKRAFLTHMHIPLDYETVRAETPANVEPSFDGLIIECSS